MALVGAALTGRDADRAAAEAEAEKRQYERAAESALAEQHDALERFAAATERKRAALAEARQVAQRHDLGPTRTCRLLPPRGFVSSEAGTELHDALQPFRAGMAEASYSG